MSSNKLHVGVFFGGRSGEHAVSLMSARFILSQLSPEKYDFTEIGITRQGEWLVGEGVLDAMMAEDVESLQSATILPDPTRPGLRRLAASSGGELLSLLADLDVAFPVLHGTFGEDGTLQGLFEMAGLAYVGAGVLGSSLGMDKAVFCDVMRTHGIPVVDTALVLRGELDSDLDSAVAKAEALGDYPFFTKPANLGSSVGVSKVRNRSDLIEGLMDAAQYDRRIVIQKGLEVREIEVAVLGNDRPEASICGEVLPGAEFYSYDAKYHDESSQTVIPAPISAEISDRIRDYALRAYKAVDIAGMARVDFFLEKGTNGIFLNELNTIPGFTQISMYPMLWEASGLPNQALVDRLIELALERKAERDATRHDYRRGD